MLRNIPYVKFVVVLLLTSSLYWSWLLREKLTDTAVKSTQDSLLRLWFAWFLLGVAPQLAFFVVMYQSTIVMPSRFVERLNRSLAHFHVAYSAEVSFARKSAIFHLLQRRKLSNIGFCALICCQNYRPVVYYADRDQNRNQIYSLYI